MAPGPEAPLHVFGNVVDRLPPGAVLAELKAHMRAKKAVFKERVRRGERVKVVAKELGLEFMEYAVQQLQGLTFDLMSKHWCYKHKKLCPVYPDMPNGMNAKPMTLATAGTTCTSWTTMSSQAKQWLADSAVAFLAWAFEQLALLPTAIIHECVPGFDIKLLESLFEPKYAVRSWVFSPTHLGMPTNRPRRYTIMFLRECMQPSIAFDATGFGKLFYRRLMLDGHAMFQAPAHEVEAFQVASATKSYLPPRQPDGALWPARLLLPEGSLGKLESYERACKKGRRRLKFIVNLYQTQTFARSKSMLIPTLLTATSLIWSMIHQRLLIPAEHLGVQGIDAFSPTCNWAVARMASQGSLTPCQVKSLAGNSFNLAAMTSVVMFLFGTAMQRDEEAALGGTIRFAFDHDAEDDMDNTE